jgi:hypothetical protein
MSELHPTAAVSSADGGSYEPPSPSGSIGTAAPLLVKPERLWAFALGAGLLAAVLSWLAGEAVVELYQPKTHVVQGMGGPMSISSSSELAVALAKNSTIAFGLLGGILGLALGFAGGMARSSTPAGIKAALVGLVLGILAGAGTSQLVLPVYNRVVDRYEDKVSVNVAVPLLMHGVIWGAIGAAGGLAFGIGTGGLSRMVQGLVGGLIGACLGAVAYEILGGFLFPLAETVQPLSITWESRLLARSAVTILAAGGAAFAILEAGGLKTKRGKV